jgi:FtsZ-interacting cell division protein YlmF
MAKKSAFQGIKKLFTVEDNYTAENEFPAYDENAQAEGPREAEFDESPNQARLSEYPAEVSARITVINPISYNDAPLVGDPYRNGIPVIMNLTKLDAKEAKRFVDFAVGLTFGLFGHLEKVTEAVFLLSPENTQVQSHDQLSDTGDFFASSN